MSDLFYFELFYCLVVLQPLFLYLCKVTQIKSKLKSKLIKSKTPKSALSDRKVKVYSNAHHTGLAVSTAYKMRSSSAFTCTFYCTSEVLWDETNL